MEHSETVLVTGGTGFVGSHCVLQLLRQGYGVRTTLRSMGRKGEIIDMMKTGGITSFDRLTFIETDLMKDHNWDEAVKGCTYVLHVASPIFLTLPKDDNEIIRPAVDGTLRVLGAARNAGVKRVVVTSNFGAVGYSHKDPTTVITEAEWTNPDAKGERFIAMAGGKITLPEIARLLKSKMPEAAKKVSSKILPNWIIYVSALFNREAKHIAPLLRVSRNTSSSKASKVLGWAPMANNEEAVLASVESMIKFGGIK